MMTAETIPTTAQSQIRPSLRVCGPSGVAFGFLLMQCPTHRVSGLSVERTF